MFVAAIGPGCYRFGGWTGLRVTESATPVA
jgi:hypothetical protein